jgi:hypothetical protein
MYFIDSLERLKKKPFRTNTKVGSYQTISNNKTFVLNTLERAKALIEKNGDYPYLQEYIDKFNEAMKTPLFAKRIKQAQKE